MRLSLLFISCFASTCLIACSNEKTDVQTSTTPEHSSQTTPETNNTAPSAVSLNTQEQSDTLSQALASENLKKSKSFLAESALKDEIKVLPSGLQYEIIEKGSADGAAPETGDIIDIDYKWAHLDGTVFDDSESRGGPARAPLVPELGQGVFEGMSLMNVGDKYKFIIPPELAFGETGTPDGVVGPNEALTFEVHLAGIAVDASAAAEEAQQKAGENLTKAKAFLAENAIKEDIITTESGLQYKIIKEGPTGGLSPTSTDQVKVHYRGTLLDGTEFDSSFSRGTPAEFGVGRVIAGWTEGLQLMSVGDKYQFFIAPELAYGERGTGGGPIGPNEALIFEVELLEIK